MNKQVDVAIEDDDFEQSVGEPRIDVLLRGWERMLEFEEEVRTGKRVIAAPSQPPSASRQKARSRGGAKSKIKAGAGDGSGS